MNWSKALFIVTLMLILTRAAYGNVVHVPTDQPTIQAGIDAAVNGDTVLVADGTYTGEGNRDIDFLGKAIAVMSENGPDSTIVNCQASYENRHQGFIFRGGEDSMSVLQGFTIRNGVVSNGGGIYIANSSPMITDNVITYNDAYQPNGLGGGIYCYNSDARIVGNTISNNLGWQGAGIYCNLGAPVIENNTLNGNYAWCVGYGGGIYIEYSAAEIIDNSIMENEADKEGGGIFNNNFSSAIPVIKRNSIHRNRAGYGHIDGGNGGGICSRGGQIEIRFNLIYGNTLGSSDLDQGMGGGLYLEFTSPGIITGNTIVSNVSWEDGGGIALNYFSDAIIRNCIVWANDALWGLRDQIVTEEQSTCSVTYSNVQDGWGGEGNIAEAPLFVDGANGDYHLRFTSPCINAGDPDFVPAPGATDIDGEARVLRGRVDMGADEVPYSHSRIPAQID